MLMKIKGVKRTVERELFIIVLWNVYAVNCCLKLVFVELMIS